MVSRRRKPQDIGFLGQGFVIEISGASGSGRREAVQRFISETGTETLYIDYAQTSWRSRGKWRNVKFQTPGDPLELLSIIAGANYKLIVVDSVPRVFYAFNLEYRARWGLVASLLALALDKASRGLNSIFINYSSDSKSFGENIFAEYFTHRALVRREGDKITLSFYHPYKADIVMPSE
jgi:hypothetical protein